MRELTLTTLHGDTDFEAAQKLHDESEIRRGVPTAQRTQVPCEVVAVFTGDGGDKAEVHFSKWSDVADLKLGKTLTLDL